MFEKEAEEYCTRQKLLEDVRDNICNAYQDGAIYGYNKANEWHFVRDGDLPKESKKYYVYSEEWGVEVRKFIADAGCFECRNNIVIAWKEIVLPKESE